MLLTETIKNSTSAIKKRRATIESKQHAETYARALAQLSQSTGSIKDTLDCANAIKESGIVEAPVIEHDEKYRNLNGMKMMFQNVAYVASNGDHGMSAASSAMRKVYDMSNSSPEVFDLILKEFTKRYLT